MWKLNEILSCMISERTYRMGRVSGYRGAREPSRDLQMNPSTEMAAIANALRAEDDKLSAYNEGGDVGAL